MESVTSQGPVAQTRFSPRHGDHGRLADAIPALRLIAMTGTTSQIITTWIRDMERWEILSSSRTGAVSAAFAC